MQKRRQALKPSRKLKRLRVEHGFELAHGGELPPRSRELERSANKYLDGNPQLSKIMNGNLTGQDSIEDAAEKINVISNTMHLCAFSFAYCIWLKSGHNQAYKGFVKYALNNRKRIDKRSSTLRLILEGVINYEDNSDAGIRKAQKLYSRDEAAIRYLVHHDIGPDQVEFHANQRGQGLHEWSSRWPKIKRETHPKASQKDKNDTEIDQELSVKVGKNISIEYKNFGYNKRTEKIEFPLEDFHLGIIDSFEANIEMHERYRNGGLSYIAVLSEMNSKIKKSGGE